MKILILLVLFTTVTTATNLGTFNPNFSNDGVTDGWDYQTSTGEYIYGQDLVVDSQNRILTTSLLGGTVTVLRYLPNGDLDNDFDTDGKIQLPKINAGNSNIGIALGKSDDFYVGYTFEFCGSECDNDMVVYHVDVTGTIISTKDVAIDLGGVAHNDLFEDIIYIANLDKIVVLSTSFVAPPQNNDFGVALLNVNAISGELTYDLNFSTDGKSSCAFNHKDVNGSHDDAESLVWSENNQTFIAGGSAVEGNGANSSGWNLGFCEFNLQGSLVRKWSTQSVANTIHDVEQLADMKIYSSGLVQSLIVSANQVNGVGDYKMAVTSYYWDTFQSLWILDTGFGDNGNGWNIINFDVFFAGNTTHDTVVNMSIEESGKVILAGYTEVLNNGSNDKYMSLSKFNINGSLDDNWGNINHKGRVTQIFSDRAIEDDISHITLNPRTEEIFISGTSRLANESNSYVAKLLNDRIFKQGFD